MRTKLALLAVLGVTSCEQACWLADYTFVREGEHVTVYGYDVDESDACAGSLDGLDDYTERVLNYLGVESSERYYYLWMSPEFFDGFCPGHSSACARSNTVFTPRLPDMHEVTHVIAHEQWGPTARVLEEGLATYLQEPFLRDAWIEPEWVQPSRMKSMLTDWDGAARDYAVAGHFVSFLVESHGIESFTQLYSRIPEASELSDWERAAAQIYGTTLDELLADYTSYPLCTVQQYRAKLWGCDGDPDHVFTPDEPEFQVTADCSDPRAGNWVTGGIFITRQVEVTEPTRFRTRVEIDGERVVGDVFMAQGCAPCSENPSIIRAATDDAAELEPGTYVILLTLDRTRGTEIALTMTAEI